MSTELQGSQHRPSHQGQNSSCDLGVEPSVASVQRGNIQDAMPKSKSLKQTQQNKQIQIEFQYLL